MAVEARAWITGEYPNQKINFELPSGPKGDKGDPGNATMRVDTTVGTRVFITDGITERMVSGDTGERNVGSLIASGWTVGSANLRRIGNTVYLRFQMYTETLTGTAPILTMPAGFRVTGVILKTLLRVSGTPSGQILLTSASASSYSTVSIATHGYADFTYTTSDPWPTTLPGTPA